MQQTRRGGRHREYNFVIVPLCFPPLFPCSQLVHFKLGIPLYLGKLSGKIPDFSRQSRKFLLYLFETQEPVPGLFFSI